MSFAASVNSPSDTPSKRPPTPAKDLELGYTSGQPAQTSSRPPSQKLSVRSGELAWNAQHPCYPHANAHVPRDSPLQKSTRLIRIPRDWMIVGDLAPTYSNTYPEILEPWVREADFRTLIKGINERLQKAFDPHGWRQMLDVVMGVATGWLWDDLGFAGSKQACLDAEKFIEQWNTDLKTSGEKDADMDLVRVIPLRRTGYLSLDIQIPDPHVGAVEDDEKENVTETADAGTEGR